MIINVGIAKNKLWVKYKGELDWIRVKKQDMFSSTGSPDPRLNKVALLIEND